MNYSRRRFLQGTTLAGAGLLAGCIGDGGGGSGGDDGSAGASGGGSTSPSGGSSGGSDGGSTPASGTANSDTLSLSTLDVGGSPGGEVVVKPEGTVTLLDFFATWCAPCKPQMEHLREIHAQFPDVHLLSITSQRDEAAIRSFWNEYDGTWPVAQDPKLRATTKYSAGQLPTMIVLDAEGTEVWRHVGLAAAESIAEELRAAGATSPQ